MILNDLINSETTLQTPLHPAGVGAWAALPQSCCLPFSSTGMLFSLFFSGVSSLPCLPLAPAL